MVRQRYSHGDTSRIQVKNHFFDNKKGLLTSIAEAAIWQPKRAEMGQVASTPFSMDARGVVPSWAWRLEALKVVSASNQWAGPNSAQFSIKNRERDF